jgi:UDP-4-amino-4,6-dideoxy-N-acetyl-beta-L-altrosamine transaminase
MIPYGKQAISQEDIDEVVSVLNSDFLTQGPKVPLFESTLAHYCQVEHAVAVNSATSALHLACLALDLGRGDILWTSPITFVASANCARYCDADVDFIDIDSQSYNLCPKALEQKLIEAKKKNRLPKVVIPVHLSGQSCDMQEIHRLSKEYGFKVIEDASHAIGGKYKGMPIGDCRYSDITVFSFHPVKIITTAEGGAAVTNDPILAEKMQRLRSHGITRDQNRMKAPSDGPWYYQQIELGFNYRMTELQAALGVSQFKRLDKFVAKRQTLAHRYQGLLQDMPLQLPKQNTDCFSAWHLYVVLLDLDKISVDHRYIFETLRQHDIGVNLHYIPVYLQPYYQEQGFSQGYCPVAENYYQRAISIPLFPDLQPQQQEYIAQTLTKVLI